MSEDFSAYSSTANMLADPLGLYSVVEDNTTSQMALDQSTGVNIDGLNLGQSMRYDYNAPGCSTQSVGRNLTLPSPTSEVWVEVYLKFSPNFTTRNVNGCSTPPDFKALFGRLTGLNCRIELHVGGASGGTAFAVGGPGCANGVGSYPGQADFGNAGVVWDGQWHRYRFHWKVSPSGTDHIYTWYQDNTLMFSKTSGWYNDGAAAQIYSLALGRNLDQGIPSGTMSLWWGRVRAWDQNPGWGF